MGLIVNSEKNLKYSAKQTKNTAECNEIVENFTYLGVNMTKIGLEISKIYCRIMLGNKPYFSLLPSLRL